MRMMGININVMNYADGTMYTGDFHYCIKNKRKKKSIRFLLLCKVYCLEKWKNSRTEKNINRWCVNICRVFWRNYIRLLLSKLETKYMFVCLEICSFIVCGRHMPWKWLSTTFFPSFSLSRADFFLLNFLNEIPFSYITLPKH